MVCRHCWTLTLVENKSCKKIYQTTSDKKLREFGHKAFHRILVTNKELKLFKIKNDDMCFQCKDLDSLEHTFLECPMNVQLYQGILLWFNTVNNTRINLLVDQMFLQNYPPPAIRDVLWHWLNLLILLTKSYIYIVVKLMRKILILYNVQIR